jgi:hypothetical protein
VIDAAQLVFLSSSRFSGSPSASGRDAEVLRVAREVTRALVDFYYLHPQVHTVAPVISRFCGGVDSHLTTLEQLVPALILVRSEVQYLLSNGQAEIRSHAERAFIHLRRSIVADPEIREKWQQAFKKGEVACEALGAVHALLHGIWAFKVSANKERTDLVYGSHLGELDSVARSGAGLVLTEWKLVRRTSEVRTIAAAARRQAGLYAGGSLAGVELYSHRYVVLVSGKPVNEDLEDHVEGPVTYRHVFVPVDPPVPSARSRKQPRK